MMPITLEKRCASPGTKGRILVCGILFYIPLPGVTWQVLHYLIGLRRLGYDPYYVEDTDRWVYDPALDDYSADCSVNIRALAPILEAYGLGERWAYRGPNSQSFGLGDADLADLYRDADALLNVTGAQPIHDRLARIPRRIYVESDPFSSQVKVAQGHQKTIDHLEAHNVHFTFGENIGAPDCGIPHTPFNWMPTRQPVVLDL